MGVLVFMTLIPLHVLNSSLQVLPVAMILSAPLLLTQKSSARVKCPSPDAGTEPNRMRATSLTALLKNIQGYTHGGLND
jgi:hypothetical protein